MVVRQVLVDTNVLLRIGDDPRTRPAEVRLALDKLIALKYDLCYSNQVVCEFWSACTRPVSANGFGLSPAETGARLEAVSKRFRLLESNEKVEEILLWLLTSRSVIGTKVHDCHLVATMLAWDIEALLTLNTQDFSRYTDLVRILHPTDVLAQDFRPA